MSTISDSRTGAPPQSASATRRKPSNPARAATHSSFHFRMSFEAGHGPSPLRNELKEPSMPTTKKTAKHSKRAPRSAPQQNSTANNSDALGENASPTPSDKINNAIGTTIPQLQTAVRKQPPHHHSTDPPSTPTFSDFALPSTSFSLPSNSPISTIPDRTLYHLSPTARSLQLSLRQQARQDQDRLHLEFSLPNQLSSSSELRRRPLPPTLGQRRHAALVRETLRSEAEAVEREAEDELEDQRRAELASLKRLERSSSKSRNEVNEDSMQVNSTLPMSGSLTSLTSSIFRSPRRGSRQSKPSGEPLSEWDLGCGEVEKGEVDETSRWMKELSRSLESCGVEGGGGGGEELVGEGEGGENDRAHESSGEEVMGMSLEEAIAEAMKETSGAVGGERGDGGEVVGTKNVGGKESGEWVEVDEEDLDGEWEEVEGE